MLAADTDFQARAGFAAALSGHLDELAHTFAIEHCEWVLLQNSFRDIRRQNFVYVIAREAERGLRKVVGSKRKELRFFGDLVCHQGCARKLDHGANEVFDFRFLLFENFACNPVHDFGLIGHFLHSRRQRNHDLGIDLHTSFRHSDSRLENGTGLHLRNFGIGNSEATSAMPEHGIKLVQIFHTSQQLVQFLQLR